MVVCSFVSSRVPKAVTLDEIQQESARNHKLEWLMPLLFLDNTCMYGTLYVLQLCAKRRVYSANTYWNLTFWNLFKLLSVFNLMPDVRVYNRAFEDCIF